jgi:hypothetical protein
MRPNQNTSWNKIYDLWLMNGELKHLLRIHKIRRYLEHGRLKADQEYDNLIAQLVGLLELQNHSGSATETFWTSDAGSDTTDIILQLTRPSQNVQLPNLSDNNDVVEFLENRLGIRIKPQPTEHYPTHPLWILWYSFAIGARNHNHRTALWLYKEVLVHYMNSNDYEKAARVLQYATNIKVKIGPLPLLHPYIIRKVMYTNMMHSV